MDRFSPFIIDVISYVFLALILLFFLVIAYRHYKSYLPNRVDAFLRYRSTGIESTGLTSSLLRATLMASSFSLASAIFVYISWAATDGVFALWSPITWTLGAFILYLFRKRIFKESRDVWTIHAFLKKKYDSTPLMKLTSLITSAVFLLQVAAEVYVGLAVLQIFFGFNTSLFTLCLIIGAIFISYCIIGGLPSVLITDKYQYRLTAFALLISAVILFNDGGSTAVKNIATSFSTTFLPSGISWVILLSLLALNLPLFITDMSIWQRVGATNESKEVTKGLGSFCLTLLGWMCLIVFIGVGFSTFFEPASGLSPAQGMLGYFRDSMVFPILLSGFIAALLSTGDTFLIASVQTIIVDWKYSSDLAIVNYDPQKLKIETHKKMLRDSRVGIFLLGFGSVGLGYVFFSYIPSLLDLLFVIFGLQTSLTIIVVWGLWNLAKPYEARAAILSVSAGAAVAIFCLILVLQGITIMGLNIALWSPLFVIIISVLVFFVGRWLYRSLH